MDSEISQSPTTKVEIHRNNCDVAEMMNDKEHHVLGRRWAATFLDFIVLASLLLIPNHLLGKQLYQETLTIWVTLLLLYFPLLEGFTGYSIGKYLCRARVIDKHGNSPGLIKSSIRTLLRIVEVNPFLAGGVPAGLVALFSKKGQRLGDMLAGTYVVSSTFANELQASKQATPSAN